MTNSPITTQELHLKPFLIFDDQWFLLTCGSLSDQHFNSMTISWGSLGIMWNKPFIQVVVRPTRYTDEFMQQYPDFSVCAFPESHRKALSLLGSKSGRDGDKLAETGLTPCPGRSINSPVFKEANLIFECRKIYTDVFHPEHFLDPAIERVYTQNDYHAIYFGEIIGISGNRTLYT